MSAKIQANIMKPCLNHTLKNAIKYSFLIGFIVFSFILFVITQNSALASSRFVDISTHGKKAPIIFANNDKSEQNFPQKVHTSPEIAEVKLLEVTKEKKEKFNLLHAKAEQGDAVAQYELGNIIYYGWHGIKTDRKKGISYYEKSAENNNAKAQYALGAYNVLRDDKKAKFWLKKAAEQGYAKAQCLLGIMYQSYYRSTPPDFTPPDFEKARYWLEKAAKQSNSRALTALRIISGSMGKYRMATGAENSAYYKAYVEENRLLNILAKQGDILAQFELADRYDHPQNDEKKALYWFKKAADEGHAKAMYNISEMYNYGNSVVKKDLKKRIDYLEQAAAQGHIDAQVDLGFIYLKGDKGLSQDFEKASKYFGQAAKQGHNRAIDVLGTMYVEGKSFPKNLEQIKYYFMKKDKDLKKLEKQTAKYVNAKEKAEQGNIRAQYSLAHMYYDGERGVPQDLKKARYWFEQIATNYEEAVKQKDKFSAELAQVQLAHMYMNGKGGEKDIKMAINWFEQADLNGDVSAPYHLGRIYLGYADSSQKNITKAISYFEKASQKSIAFAAASWIELGLIYEFGKGTIPIDYQKAKEYYEKASDYGNAQSQFNLGSLYYDAKGVKKDYKKAIYWWEKVAKQGNIQAQFNLGVMYNLGEGVKKNLKKSANWFNKAAIRGHSGAMYILGGALEYGQHGIKKNLVHAYGYVLILLRLDPDDEHLKKLEIIQSRFLNEYKLSPEQIKEAESFAAKIWQDIEASGTIINHRH